MRHSHITTRLLYIGLSFLPAISALTSCGDPHQTREQIATATDMGRQRALQLSPESIGKDTVALQNTLLDVREREHRLRSRGHDRVADAYINSFLSTLDSVNPSLAATIR